MAQYAMQNNQARQAVKEPSASLVYFIVILLLLAVGLGIGFYKSYNLSKIYEQKVVGQNTQIDTLKIQLNEQLILVDQQKELILDMGESIRRLQGGVLK